MRKQNELNISYYSWSNSIRLRVKEFMTDTWDAHNFSITLSQKLSSTKLKDYNLSQKQNKFKLGICRVKEFMTDTWDAHNFSITLSQKLSSTKLKDYNLSQKQNKFKLGICRVKEFMTDTWDVHNYSTTLSQKSTKRIPIISSQT